MKKILAFLLILAMSVSMLVGCGGSDNEANKDVNKESNSDNDTNVNQNESQDESLDENQNDDESTDEGRVYVVEVDDPELADKIQALYHMIKEEPESPDGYVALAEFYLMIGENQAAMDVAKAGLKETGEDFFNEIIAMASSAGNESNAGTSDDETEESEMKDSETPEVAKNQCIMGSEKLGYYRVTFDENYVYTRKEKFSDGWVHFDDKGVQIKYSVKAFENFEAFYQKEKENLDWNVSENLVTNLVIGETKQVQCGNVTAYYFEYSFTEIGEKVTEPTEYKTQKFYVQLGEGVGVYGSTNKFLDGGYSFSDTNGSRTITIEDYLKYVFVNVEKIEQ